ncbi:MAG: glutathione S-transferase family protein [Gammaproteobacteria bacterium]|nr:glutathione S-transferase family protein [Gammaproteobacteria bacterium]
MLTLYHSMRSYASQKVRLYLAEKSIPWKSQHIDLLKQEHLTPTYIAINPRALVPTLIAGDKTIFNSSDIMQYIEDHFPSTATIDADLSKRIYNFCKDDEKLHDPHIRTLSYHYLWLRMCSDPSH